MEPVPFRELFFAINWRSHFVQLKRFSFFPPTLLAKVNVSVLQGKHTPPGGRFTHGCLSSGGAPSTSELGRLGTPVNPASPGLGAAWQPAGQAMPGDSGWESRRLALDGLHRSPAAHLLTRWGLPELLWGACLLTLRCTILKA